MCALLRSRIKAGRIQCFRGVVEITDESCMLCLGVCRVLQVLFLNCILQDRISDDVLQGEDATFVLNARARFKYVSLNASIGKSQEQMNNAYRMLVLALHYDMVSVSYSSRQI